jgi:ankyrin repeat protein
MARLLSGFPVLRSLIVDHNLAMLTFMIDQGADPAVVDLDGATLLHVAVECGYSDVCSLLLDRHVDVEARNDSGEAPLHLAAGRGSVPMVKLLLARGADARAVWQPEGAARELMPYQIAELGGHLECARLLFVSSDLHRACAEGDLATVTKLLQAEEEGLVLGPHVTEGDKDVAGRTEMHSAVEALMSGRATAALIRQLVLHGAGAGRAELLSQPDKEGMTPLGLLLRSAEARKAGASGGGGSAAPRSAAVDPWDLLVEDGVLHAVCALGSEATFSSLIKVLVTGNEAGARAAASALAARDDSSFMALHYAAATLNAPLVERLLRLGSLPGAVSKTGKTAVHEALNPTVHKFLKAVKCMTVARGRRPRGAASEVLMMLCSGRGGAAVNIADGKGETPLHLACSLSAYEETSTLLELGADPHATDLLALLPIDRIPADNQRLRHLVQTAMETKVKSLGPKPSTLFSPTPPRKEEPSETSPPRLVRLQAAWKSRHDDSAIVTTALPARSSASATSEPRITSPESSEPAAPQLPTVIYYGPKPLWDTNWNDLGEDKVKRKPFQRSTHKKIG